jgi:hypothetical protein
MDLLRSGFLFPLLRGTGMRPVRSRGGNESLVAGTEPAKSCRDAHHVRHPPSRRAHWLVLSRAASLLSRGKMCPESGPIKQSACLVPSGI